MNKQEAIKRVEELYGYGTIATAVADIISQIHELQNVVVPKFVAEWIEYCKSNELTLLGAFDPVSEHGIGLANTFTGEVWKGVDWAKRNQETFARAWLDGYQVEQEKLYTVELFNRQPLVEANNVLYFSSNLAASNAHVSKDKLEKAGFGWVFDCSGVKVVEAD